MTTTPPSQIDARARVYIAAWDHWDCIEQTAIRGTSEEDDSLLCDAYGDDAPAIALRIQELCQEHVNAHHGDTTMTTDLATARSIIGEGYYQDYDDYLIVHVPDDEPDDTLDAASALDDALGESAGERLISAGYRVEWTGDGDTDADGATTSDVRISGQEVTP